MDPNDDEQITEEVQQQGPQKKTHENSAKMKGINEDEKELKGSDIQNHLTKITASQGQKVQVQGKDIDLLMKEFDLERYRAIRILKMNDGDIKQTIEYLLNN